MKTPDDMDIHSIIPARSGSKGIENKNMKKLCGKTLLERTIEHSRKAKWIDYTWVSSDSEDIRRHARNARAHTIGRPNHLAQDGTPTEPVIEDWYSFLHDYGETKLDYIVLLQCTSPIRRPSDIDAAIYETWKNDYDSLFSSNGFKGFVWNKKSEDGSLQSVTYNYWDRPRRQDMSDQYMENGSIYVFKPFLLQEEGSRLGFQIGTYKMTLPGSWIEIDEPNDLKLAEFYMKEILQWES